LLAQDPSVFQYDEVLDDIKAERNEESVAQAVRADVQTQKKRTGLTVPEGAEGVRTGVKRQTKYIEKVKVATDRRRVEQQIVEDRLLKKEKNARKDAEVFVTEAFKEELKKRQKFVDELERQEAMDEARAAEKQEHGTGFADMYRNLLNGGLATSRGGEKVKEVAAPRQDLESVDAKTNVKIEQEVLDRRKAVKKEGDDTMHDVDDVATKSEDVKAEAETTAAASVHGVQDVVGPPAPEPGSKQAEAVEEEDRRAEKALSARERFLARKRQQQAAEAAAAAAEG